MHVQLRQNINQRINKIITIDSQVLDVVSRERGERGFLYRKRILFINLAQEQCLESFKIHHFLGGCVY